MGRDRHFWQLLSVPCFRAPSFAVKICSLDLAG